MSPGVKVCGVGDAAFARAAAASGVDYLGFIFEPSSPRAVSVEKAAEIVGELRCAGLLRGCRTVGVFVGQTAAEIAGTMRRARLDVVQLHRRASAEDVAALRAEGFEVWTLAGGAEGDAVLFDSSHGDGEKAFRKGPRRTVLAGRVGAESVAAALALGPDVIDVNSSLETSPGRKSPELLAVFMRALAEARRAVGAPA